MRTVVEDQDVAIGLHVAVVLVVQLARPPRPHDLLRLVVDDRDRVEVPMADHHIAGLESRVPLSDWCVRQDLDRVRVGPVQMVARELDAHQPLQFLDVSVRVPQPDDLPLGVDLSEDAVLVADALPHLRVVHRLMAHHDRVAVGQAMRVVMDRVLEEPHLIAVPVDLAQTARKLVVEARVVQQVAVGQQPREVDTVHVPRVNDVAVHVHQVAVVPVVRAEESVAAVGSVWVVHNNASAFVHVCCSEKGALLCPSRSPDHTS